MIMPAPTTIAAFLEVVRKSGVLEEARLDERVRQLQSAGQMPSDPAKLAELLVREGLLSDFQSRSLLQGKYLGFTLGEYVVLNLLGSGGMSRVYLCEHRQSRQRYAVKVLSRTEDATLLKRFYREARAASALAHPNIVRGLEIGQYNNDHFLVMEYVDGASLHQVVAEHGPLTIPQACHYIRQAALGLQHAHEHGLVHRDIKPGNLLVDRQGTVKILDLGLARFAEDTEESTLTRGILGTVDYLAPEQSRDSHEVDIRADIYSLGATFYFLLTGIPPFNEGTAEKKMRDHRNRQALPIWSLRADVPEALAVVIDKMMTKAPYLRYQTPAEVVQALQPWTQGPVPPPPDLTPLPASPLVLPSEGRSTGRPRLDTAGVGQPLPTPRVPAAPITDAPRMLIDSDSFCFDGPRRSKPASSGSSSVALAAPAKAGTAWAVAAAVAAAAVAGGVLWWAMR
jgi:serine/threonine protein kinase